MKKANIADTVWELLTPTAQELGYVIWDVEYVREGGVMILRVTIDKDGGVTIDDCEKFHRAIDPIIDEADPIENSYTLEVSSPGIERELKYAWHYECCRGETVEVHLYRAYNGQKTLVGNLLPLDECINIERAGEKISIPKADTAKVNIYFDISTVK